MQTYDFSYLIKYGNDALYKECVNFFRSLPTTSKEDVSLRLRFVIESYIWKFATINHIELSKDTLGGKIEQCQGLLPPYNYDLIQNTLRPFSNYAHHKPPKAKDSKIYDSKSKEEIGDLVKDLVSTSYPPNDNHILEKNEINIGESKITLHTDSTLITSYGTKHMCTYSRSGSETEVSFNSKGILCMKSCSDKRENTIEHLIEQYGIGGCAVSKLLHNNDTTNFYFLHLQEGENLMYTFKKRFADMNIETKLKIAYDITAIIKSLNTDIPNCVICHRNINPSSVLMKFTNKDSAPQVRIAFFEKAKVSMDNEKSPTSYSQYQAHTCFNDIDIFIHPCIRKIPTPNGVTRNNSKLMDVYSIIVLFLYMVNNGNISRYLFDKKQLNDLLLPFSKNFRDNIKAVINNNTQFYTKVSIDTLSDMFLQEIKNLQSSVTHSPISTDEQTSKADTAEITEKVNEYEHKPFENDHTPSDPEPQKERASILKGFFSRKKPN